MLIMYISVVDYELLLFSLLFLLTHIIIVVIVCRKIEEHTRMLLSGKDINDIYDDIVVDEATAEGDDVERTRVE